MQAAQNKQSGSLFKISDSNMKLLTQYWDAEYEDRKIKRPEAAWSRLEWGLAQIGDAPLLSNRKILQKIVDNAAGGDRRKQRRICGVLNQLRKFFGINERLRLERKTLPKFKYLTEGELRHVLPFVSVGHKSKVNVETYRWLFQTLFSSGCRTGEAFALKKDSLRKNTLMVLTQLDREEIETETKTGQTRATYMLDIGVEVFDSWVKAHDKKYIQRNGIARILKRACQKAFPHDPSKWITAHDLRHSYAVMLLTKYDISISQIAKALGNSVSVCEDYYLRFHSNDDLIDSIARKIDKVR